MKNLALSWNDEIGIASYEKVWEHARKAARQAINQMDIRTLYDFQKSKNGLYCCPCCGSGTGAHKTGALRINKSGTYVTCNIAGCKLSNGGKGNDVLGTLQNLLSLDETAIFNRFLPNWNPFQKHGQARPDGSRPAVQPVIKAQPEEDPNQEKAYIQDWTEYFQACAARIQETDYHRGISLETLQAYQIGYDPKWYHPKHIWEKEHGQRQKMPPPAPHLIIPTSDRSYLARYTGDSSTLPEAAQWMVKIKVGSIHIFNEGAFRNGATVFVTEGEINALSILDCGYDAAAIGTANNTDDFIEHIKFCNRNGFLGACIIAMDPDQAGQTAAAKLMQGLQQIPGISVMDATMALCSDGNDINDELIQDRAGLTARLEDLHQAAQELMYINDQAAMSTAADPDPDPVGDPGQQASTDSDLSLSADQQQEQAAPGESAGTALQGFLSAIQTDKYKPIPTPLQELNRKIGGGLIRQQLVMLGAPPGLGKTAFCQWILEGIAQAGAADILYLNMEMSREQLLARTLSRIVSSQGIKMTATEILQGYKWTEEQRQAVLRAADTFNQNADRIQYNPDGLDGNLDRILAYIEQAATAAESQGKKAPIVCLDYLQLLRGNPREESAEIIKRALETLKKHAIKHDTVVVCIMAQGRTANNADTITQAAGRDTSAIEYSGDLMLGMAYTRTLKRPGWYTKKADQLNDEQRKYITLKVTKSRFAAPGAEIDLYFQGETMTYTVPPDGVQWKLMDLDEDEEQQPEQAADKENPKKQPKQPTVESNTFSWEDVMKTIKNGSGD